MHSDAEKILLQGQNSMLHLLSDIYQNDLLLIELIRSGENRPEVLAAIARNVRSGLYVLDGLGDNLRAILESNPNL